MLMMKETFEVERQEKILTARSAIQKAIMVKGGPFLSARNPQKILHSAELRIMTIRPTLIK
jgi:hypothetical protein